MNVHFPCRVDVSPAAVFGLVKEEEEKEGGESEEGVRKRRGKEEKGGEKWEAFINK